MTAWDMAGLRAAYGGPQGSLLAFMTVVTMLGGGWAACALVPLALWPRTRRVSGALALAVAAQAVLVWELKRVFGRVRPWIALGFPAPWGRPLDPSFPSGHAAGSFCVAVFLALLLLRAAPGIHYGIRAAVSACMLALAGLVAFSRVYLGVHFPSDVLVGGALGALVGAAAASWVESADKRS